MDGEGLALAVLSICLINIARVNAHGRMIEPPSRGSVWRFGYEVAKNYNDNGLNCGGFQVQWLLNGGRCGHCGDPYTGPRDHERGGKYANDVITRTYLSGDVINVTIDVTANHGGYFRFFLCPKPRLSEECFNAYPLIVVGEGYRHSLSLQSRVAELQVKLPKGIICEHCVLQWHWNCGQSYGLDLDTGAYCKGCGAQEQFRNCADIAIETFNRLSHSFGMENHIQQLRSKLLLENPFPRILQVPSDKMAGVLPPFRLSPFKEQTTGECRGSITYGIVLDAWCKLHCAVGFCPPSHCTCI